MTSANSTSNGSANAGGASVVNAAGTTPHAATYNTGRDSNRCGDTPTRPAANVRFATCEDVSLILEFIKGLADYEHMSDEVIADEATLKEWIFDKQKAEVIFALEGEREVGFALFFHNFSTFLGRAGIYLEDLFVLPEYRGRGHGKRLLQTLASITVERGCGRLEWSCLDWNQPSIDFYLSLGAEPLSDWTSYRLTGDTLHKLAK